MAFNFVEHVVAAKYNICNLVWKAKVERRKSILAICNTYLFFVLIKDIVYFIIIIIIINFIIHRVQISCHLFTLKLCIYIEAYDLYCTTSLRYKVR